MVTYSNSERAAAIFLRRFPKFKAYLKLVFQILMYIRHRSAYRFKPFSHLSMDAIGEQAGYTFFGYFAQPVEQGGAMLYHSCQFDTSKAPKNYADLKVSIEVVCQENGEERYRSKTRAFNWQQGAKLTWVDQGVFCYNTFNDEGQLVARQVNLNTNSVSELSEPIYEKIDENTYISLGFEALTRLNPDYGYAQLPSQNGSSYFSIAGFDGTNQLMLTIDDVNNQLNIEGDSHEHCLNHASVSPDKSRVVLIHRSYPSGVRTDRLLLMNLNATDQGFSIAIDSGMVSHYDWLSDNQLICYMRYDGAEGYFVITFNELVNVTHVDIPELKVYGDGHPARVSTTSFITDTYPNKARMKTLLYVNLTKKVVKPIAEFYEPIKMSSEGRCDLHPRYDEVTGKLFVDSDHDGSRQLYAITLEEKLL